MFRSVLDDLPRGKAKLLRWPPGNGGYTLGFHTDDAAAIVDAGGIMLDGQWARVVDVDPDEPRIIAFRIPEGEYDERTGEPLPRLVAVAA